MRLMMRWHGVAVFACIVVVAANFFVLDTASAEVSSDHGQQQLGIVILSNPRPWLVSGGDVLVKIVPDRGGGRVRVAENGRDISDGFVQQPDGTLLGLVAGLRLGGNDLTATANGHRVSVTLVNHPSSGPVFSGPQQWPFFCETKTFDLAQPEEEGLCEAPAVVTYRYRTTAGKFEALVDPTSRPADLALATVQGRTVPYVVRVETGTIDRAVYQIAALYDGGSPSPLRQNTSWNDKLVYTFGGGCNGGYHQGDSTGMRINNPLPFLFPDDDLFLSEGYAVASSSLNVLGHNCSTIISAEAAMMVKEHFIETYGPLRYTIGWGTSGGAIQQYDIADAYPGILDGIVPNASYPDILTVFGPVSDCRLLKKFFRSDTSFTDDQREAIAGFIKWHSCESWDSSIANSITAIDSCNPIIPVSKRWDPVTKPKKGVRCSAAEQWVNQLGRDPRTGFVRSTLDNVGVQYGLTALQPGKGQITPEQFITLNEKIGGFDVAGAPVTQRSMADPEALRAAYRNDLVNSAAQGLRTTPIIDQRLYLDQLDSPTGLPFDSHTAQWSYVMRARLLAANGTADNQVIIEHKFDQFMAASDYELHAMDQWLTNINDDHSSRSQQAKVVANKPAGLGDGCYRSAKERIVAPLTYPASGQCEEAGYLVGADPRLVAGQQLSENTLKCSLRPINFADYPVTFTKEQQDHLRQKVFPSGVCDYRRPGVGQSPPIGVWLNYGDR
jgi:hypothetical protein